MGAKCIQGGVKEGTDWDTVQLNRKNINSLLMRAGYLVWMVAGRLQKGAEAVKQ